MLCAASPCLSGEPSVLPAGEAPLPALARAFALGLNIDSASTRLKLLSDGHEVVLAPGLPRALVDGSGVPLSSAPRFDRGVLLVSGDLADLLRLLGSPREDSAAPWRDKPEPGVRPRSAGTLRETLPFPDSLRVPGALCGEAAGPEIGDARCGLPEGRGGFVVLDPGHGGADEGSRGPGGTLEKDVVLDIALRAAGHLRSMGVRVELTRADDRYVAPERRAEVVNLLRPDSLVSVHANAFPAQPASGVETWVLPARYAPSADSAKRSRLLAAAAQAALVRETRARDRGVREGLFTVLRDSKVPAVLVEVGFISNPGTERLLADPKARERLARALAEAVAASGVLRAPLAAAGRPSR